MRSRNSIALTRNTTYLRIRDFRISLLDTAHLRARTWFRTPMAHPFSSERVRPLLGLLPRSDLNGASRGIPAGRERRKSIPKHRDETQKSVTPIRTPTREPDVWGTRP